MVAVSPPLGSLSNGETMAGHLLESFAKLFYSMAIAAHKGDSAGVHRAEVDHDGPVPLLIQRLRGIQKRRIHLTFDDGPHPTNTPRVLDELRYTGVQATFFVLGKKLETELGQKLMKRAAAEGHQIGNHTYSHPHLTELTEEQIREEILRTEHLIGDANKGVRILRPPYGEHNSLVERVARDLGYRLVLWNVDSGDWDPQYQGRWVDHATEQIVNQEQSIVLAHDNQTTTATRIRDLIEQIQELPGSSFIGCSKAIHS
jgi:peptidoglycan-N-acetylglucosamine deacetylase